MGDAHLGEAEWAYPLSRWVGAAASVRVLQVRQPLEQRERLELPMAQGPQKQQRREQERRVQPGPALRDAAQHFRTKK